MLCANCVGEPFLQALIAKQALEGPCEGCADDAAVISFVDLADLVESAFEAHYTRTPTQPDAMEYSAIKEGLLDWYREGERTVDVIADACGISDVAAEAIREILEERHADPFSTEVGDECEYESDAHYERSAVSAQEVHERWHELERTLKTEARFFNQTASTVLDEVFQDLPGASTNQGLPVIRLAGPGTDVLALYRARVFQSDEPLQKALQAPDVELAAPSARFAAPGRMNAHGVSVFYGASHPDVALGEVRPPVGSRVLIGRFDIVSPLRLLDVEALRSVAVEGSIFDPAYAGRLRRARFLEALAEMVTRPVMPDDQVTDYLVTQAMADYLASRKDLKLSGVIYATSQGPTEGFNVALFNPASRTQRLDLPPGTSVQASLYEEDEDGQHPHYWVSEEVPKAGPPGARDPAPKGRFQFDPIDFVTDHLQHTLDFGAFTLTLDLKSLQVLHVTAVTYSAESHGVVRFRSERSNDDKF